VLGERIAAASQRGMIHVIELVARYQAIAALAAAAPGGVA
jgi:hypothetical protein